MRDGLLPNQQNGARGGTTDCAAVHIKKKRRPPYIRESATIVQKVYLYDSICSFPGTETMLLSRSFGIQSLVPLAFIIYETVAAVRSF